MQLNNDELPVEKRKGQMEANTGEITTLRHKFVITTFTNSKIRNKKMCVGSTA